MRFLSFVPNLLLAASLTAEVSAGGLQNAANIFQRAEAIKARVVERRGEAQNVKNPATMPMHIQKRQSKYLNSKSQQFVVNGTGIPDVDFDIGESYAGLLPISDAPGETRKLFFWFFPSSNPAASNEVTAWFNGGPGCSSLSGLLTENGPFTWMSGTLTPVQNPYSWTNLTNMIWIEQPIGVGYDQGSPNITNEVQLGEELVGFWKQFFDTFNMHGYDTYLTGESYAGYYVPYIANAFINHADDTYYKLKGISINDPIIGDETVQQQVVLRPYVDYWENLLFLNQTFLDRFRARDKECGYTDYFDKYLQYPPPKGSFPVLPDPYNSRNYTCDQFDSLYEALLLVNPCFNIYHITETCPHPYSVLGAVNTGDYVPPGLEVYFNRTDVQQAINAPPTNWMQCSARNVFGNGQDNNRSRSDESLGPAQNGVLQRVIEYTNNTIIGSGDLDMLLNTNGTLMAIQNMTWNGMQGLQKYPSTDFYTPHHPEYNGGALSGAGVVGSYGIERGLTFYRVQLAGHELPGYAPGAAYRMLEVLLGRINNLSNTSDFTTQTGNFTGTTSLYKRAERPALPRRVPVA